MKGSWKLFLALISIVLISLLIIVNNDKFNTSLACAKSEEFKNQEYGGIMQKKYLDKDNHQVRTIKLKNEETIILARDTSIFYSFVQQNDSIVKERGMDFLNVYRMGKIYKFKIYFGCSE